MIRFAVMTDLHTDIIHDGADRVDAFVTAANERKCDFAIQLGDFIQPGFIGRYTCSEDRVSNVMRNILSGKGLSPSEKKEIFDRFNKLECPLYHVIGNHDLDLYTKDEVLEYWNVKNAYYSFDVGEYHFVVLDANYAYDSEEEIEFARGNYMKWYFQKHEPFPYIPKDEIEWLRKDLSMTDKPSIIFCHEGINGGFLNIVNHQELFEVIKAAPAGVLLGMCGHKHENLLEYEEGIPVYFVNSISGYSVPAQFACRRFDDEIESKYPNVQYMCVYEEPLFVIVTIDGDRISIEGRETEFVSPGPEEIGVHFEAGNITLTAESSSVELINSMV